MRKMRKKNNNEDDENYNNEYFDNDDNSEEGNNEGKVVKLPKIGESKGKRKYIDNVETNSIIEHNENTD